MSDLEEPKKGVSRRTVTKAMAWSVPAIALAVPAPAYASSPDIVTLTGLGCKKPGASVPGQPDTKIYWFEVVITNDSDQPLTVVFTSLTVNGETKSPVTPSSTTVPANTVRTITVSASGFADSANGTATLNYTIDGVAGSAGPTPFNDLPPTTGQGAGCNLLDPGEYSDAPITP